MENHYRKILYNHSHRIFPIVIVDFPIGSSSATTGALGSPVAERPAGGLGSSGHRGQGGPAGATATPPGAL